MIRLWRTVRVGGGLTCDPAVENGPGETGSDSDPAVKNGPGGTGSDV